MTRLLLFDSHCVQCSSAAAEIAHTSKGEVTPRSLQDPVIRQSLDAVSPGWRARPMLVETNDVGEFMKVYAGARFVAKLVSIVGARDAARVLRAITGGATAKAESDGVTRRGAIVKTAGVVGGIVVGTSALSADAFAASTAHGTAPVSDRVLAMLKQNSAIHEAENSFGKVDWASATALDDVVVVNHVGSVGMFTAVAVTGKPAISYRFSSGRTPTAWRVDWMKTSGTPLAVSNATGVAVPQDMAITPDNSFSDWVTRFQICIGSCPVEHVVDTCRSCGNSGNPKGSACVACGILLGYNGIKCALSSE